MTRNIIVGAGALVAFGFLAASAVANYLFGASLGRSPWEAMLYGGVGVLAVALNALAPFYISWALAVSRKATAAAIAVLWGLCLVYATTSALGFAAQNREGIVVSRQVTHEAYEDTRRELLDLEARRSSARIKDRPALDARIDEVRRRVAALRQDLPMPADAQSAFLAALTFGSVDPGLVRIALVILFSLMIEMGASIGLFAALSHAAPKPDAAAPRPRWTPNAG